MKPQKPQLYAIVGIIIGFIIIASAVPINNNIDIVTNIGIEYPLLSSPKLTAIDTEITAHTLFHLPSLSMASIISSSDMKISVIGGNKRMSKTIGTLYRTETGTYTVVLPNVPPNTNSITVELYSGSEKIDTQEVKLT